MRLRVVGPVVALALVVDRRPGGAAALHADGERAVPGRGPEIRLVGIELDELPFGALGVDLIVMRNEAPGDDPLRIAALLDGHASVVGDQVGQPFGHREHLGLVPLGVGRHAGDDHRELTGDHGARQVVADVAGEVLEPDADARNERDRPDDLADGAAVGQRVEHLVVADVAARRRAEGGRGRPRTAAVVDAGAHAPGVQLIELERARGRRVGHRRAGAAADEAGRADRRAGGVLDLELVRERRVAAERRRGLGGREHDRVGLLAVDRRDRGGGTDFQRRTVGGGVCGAGL